LGVGNVCIDVATEALQIGFCTRIISPVGCPIGDLKSNQNTDYNDEKIDEYREPVLAFDMFSYSS
jgi:hypothetical protein